MLYREIIVVCSEIHTKHINTLSGQKVELLNVQPVGVSRNQQGLEGHPVRKSVSRKKWQAGKKTFEASPSVHSCSQSLLLFQLNAHNTFHTHIYHHLPPTCFGVCYTISRETIGLLAQNLYAFCSVVS
jgi:hypothetical protein